MADPATSSEPSARSTVISIDALGNDTGLGAIIGGMEKSAAKNPNIRFIVHGPEAEIAPLLARKPGLQRCTEIRDVSKTISMTDKPAQAMRQGKGTSMWNTLQTVADGEATVAVSCGNTGALMALAMLRLRRAPGVIRPALAVMWPSRNKTGYNVLLDVGADIKADAQDLLTFAVMGAAYARNGLALKKPRVGVLNLGTEDHKGRAELREAADLIEDVSERSDFEAVGFVEGSDIGSDTVDVIVTDGFSGNIALKTAEGTAKNIREMLKEAFEYSPFSRIGALFALTSLRRMSKRIDPRRVNGGVFLGLNGTVVKSHGSADATGVSAAIKLAFTLAQNGFAEKLAARVASAGPQGQSVAKQSEAEAN